MYWNSSRVGSCQDQRRLPATSSGAEGASGGTVRTVKWRIAFIAKIPSAVTAVGLTLGQQGTPPDQAGDELLGRDSGPPGRLASLRPRKATEKGPGLK